MHTYKIGEHIAAYYTVAGSQTTKRVIGIVDKIMSKRMIRLKIDDEYNAMFKADCYPLLAPLLDDVYGFFRVNKCRRLSTTINKSTKHDP